MSLFLKRNKFLQLFHSISNSKIRHRGPLILRLYGLLNELDFTNENKFRGNYKSTLGVNLLKKDMKIEGYGDVSAQIWDLGGQESFKSLRKLYLEGANGALIIYDCNKRSSFEKLYDWIQDFKDARGDEPLLLIGNKNDLTDNIKIEESEALELAKSFKMEFISTSAKTGANVEEAFLKVLK